MSTKQIMFRSYSYYSVGLFPGIGIMQKSDYEFQAGCVIKTEGSEFSKRWKEYWQKRQEMRECNLYVMFWTSESKAIHVIADSVELI